MAVQLGLCQAWSESTMLVFSNIINLYALYLFFCVIIHRLEWNLSYLNLLPLCWFIFALGATPSTAMKKTFRGLMSRDVRKPDFCIYAKTKTQISCAVTAQLISAFVFATGIVQPLYFLLENFKSLASFSNCTAWFVWDLVWYPEDRFSDIAAQLSSTG